MKHAGVRQTAGKSPHGTHAYGRATHPDHRLPCPSAVCLLPGATRCGMSTGAGCPTWPALWSLCCATPPVLPLLAPPGMPAPVVRDEEPSSDTLGLAHGRRRSAAAALSRVHLCLCWIADLVSGGVRCQRPWKALHEGISIIQGPCLHRAHTTRSYTACTNAYGQAGAPDHEHQAPSTKLHRPRNAHEGMSPVQHAAWGRGMQREPPSWQWLAAQASICCLSLLQPQSLAGCQSLQQQHLLLRLLVSLQHSAPCHSGHHPYLCIMNTSIKLRDVCTPVIATSPALHIGTARAYRGQALASGLPRGPRSQRTPERRAAARASPSAHLPHFLEPVLHTPHGLTACTNMEDSPGAYLREVHTDAGRTSKLRSCSVRLLCARASGTRV